MATYQDLSAEAQRRSMFWRDLYARYNPDFALRQGINMPEMTQSTGAINSLLGKTAGKLQASGGTGSQYRVAEANLERMEGARAAQAAAEHQSGMNAFLRNAQSGIKKVGRDFNKTLGIGAAETKAGERLGDISMRVKDARERAQRAVDDSEQSGFEAFLRGIGGSAGDVAGYYLGKKLYKNPYEKDEKDEE